MKLYTSTFYSLESNIDSWQNLIGTVKDIWLGSELVATIFIDNQGIQYTVEELVSLYYFPTSASDRKNTGTSETVLYGDKYVNTGLDLIVGNHIR